MSELADHVIVVESKIPAFMDNWCSAGAHYSKYTVRVFSDPGDCEVYVCGDCMGLCLEKLKRVAATVGDGHGK